MNATLSPDLDDRDLARQRRLLAPLLPDSLRDADDATIRDVFAAATWSFIAAPDEGAAAVLRDAGGAAAALQRLVDDEPFLGVDADVVARWRLRVASARLEPTLLTSAALELTVLTPAAAEWPTQLDDLDPSDRPVTLWVRGSVAAVTSLTRSVALVGSRASSGYGEAAATDLVGGVVAAGVATVAGGAYGIDACVHRTTLQAGGVTVAVLASGLDRLYPPGNASLLARIADDGGALVSEAPCGVSPSRARFAARHRLTAALASATIVVEATAQSPSLTIAAAAAALQRRVGAVPGPLTSGASAGCHAAIRNGATLIGAPDDAVRLATTPGRTPA